MNRRFVWTIVVPVVALSGCAAQAPQTVVREVHHHHYARPEVAAAPKAEPAQPSTGAREDAEQTTTLHVLWGLLDGGHRQLAAGCEQVQGAKFAPADGDGDAFCKTSIALYGVREDYSGVHFAAWSGPAGLAESVAAELVDELGRSDWEESESGQGLYMRLAKGRIVYFVVDSDTGEPMLKVYTALGVGTLQLASTRGSL